MMIRLAVFFIRYLVSLFCCVYVHSAGILFRRHRRIIRLINSEFGFTLFDRDEDPPNRIPETPFSEICSSELPIKILVPEVDNGGIFPLELICMNQIVSHFAPERVFEIGTFNGRTTLNLAANTKATAGIFTLDLPLGHQAATTLRQHSWDGRFVETRDNGRYFRESVYREKIRQLYGDSAAFDYGPYAGTIDMVFVDGSHSYEYVTSDSEKALALLRNGKGVILWHDYGTKWHDVTRALNDLYETNHSFAGMKHIRGTSLVFQRIAPIP